MSAVNYQFLIFTFQWNEKMAAILLETNVNDGDGYIFRGLAERIIANR